MVCTLDAFLQLALLACFYACTFASSFLCYSELMFAFLLLCCRTCHLYGNGKLDCSNVFQKAYCFSCKSYCARACCNKFQTFGKVWLADKVHVDLYNVLVRWSPFILSGNVIAVIVCHNDFLCVTRLHGDCFPLLDIRCCSRSICCCYWFKADTSDCNSRNEHACNEFLQCVFRFHDFTLLSKAFFYVLRLFDFCFFCKAFSKLNPFA